jgi:3D (Asp-Asp-Asp) domain-containing protein
MQSSEAQCSSKPQIVHRSVRIKSMRQRTRVRFLIFLLFAILILLLLNVLLYESYKKAKEQYKVSEMKVELLEDEKLQLTEDVNELGKEIEDLKKQYNNILAQNEKVRINLREITRQNEELAKKNRELIDENIALQNSLKMAASVGIKPQNYTKFNGISSRSSLERGRYIGTFIGTAYTPSKEECGNTKGITRSGKPIIPGVTIAVDQNYWPLGSIFYIKGLGYAVAMDTGSAIKGKYRFDFSVFDKEFAKKLGVRKWDVYLIKLGNGNVEQISF